jgi:hypothetical protein
MSNQKISACFIAKYLSIFSFPKEIEGHEKWGRLSSDSLSFPCGMELYKYPN